MEKKISKDLGKRDFKLFHCYYLWLSFDLVSSSSVYADKNDIPIISLVIIAIKFSVKYFIDLPSSTRSSHRRCSVKNVFLKISQISQENTCSRVSFLIKFQAEACNFIEKENLVQVFSCEVYEILRAPFLQNTFEGCFCTRNHYR